MREGQIERERKSEWEVEEKKKKRMEKEDDIQRT